MNEPCQVSQKVMSFLSKIDWLPPLLVRLAVGYVFLMTGKGKLSNLDRTTEFFQSLGIPMAHANAILVSTLECAGGILFMAGFLTRLISIPLAAIMAVAIATAKWGDVADLADFAGLSELAYLLIFLWFITAGAGRASVDHLICSKCDKPTPV